MGQYELIAQEMLVGIFQSKKMKVHIIIVTSNIPGARTSHH